MNYLTEELQSNIQREFPDIPFEYREINFGGIIPIFFINIEDEIKLTNQWKAITEFIAVHFQSSLRNEFSVWNIYLFFILEHEIKNDLKYIIENDTFSSRKIIIYPKKDIESIIQEHIINDDLNLKVNDDGTSYTHNSEKDKILDYFEELLIDENSKIVEGDKLNETRNIVWEVLKDIESKKKISEDLRSGLDRIILEIKTIENGEV
jgi:hypothetical protein